MSGPCNSHFILAAREPRPGAVYDGRVPATKFSGVWEAVDRHAIARENALTLGSVPAVRALVSLEDRVDQNEALMPTVATKFASRSSL